MKTNNPHYFHIDQYNNIKNANAYEHVFGPELIRDLNKIDYFICAGSTGGTITGTGRYLKKVNPDCKIILIDPKGSIFTDAFLNREQKGHSFLVEGVGKNFVPGVIDFSVIDEVINVTDKQAFAMCKVLAKEEGVLGGGSGGANVWGALQLSYRVKKDAVIATLIPDSGLKYMSKVQNDEWLESNNIGFKDLEYEDIQKIATEKCGIFRDKSGNVT